jgi:hypothetical protein
MEDLGFKTDTSTRTCEFFFPGISFDGSSWHFYGLVVQVYIVSRGALSSVADPGCFDPNFFHLGSEFFPSWIPDPHQRI